MSTELKKHVKLRGFQEHGIVFQELIGDQARGVCPVCGKPKLYVNVNTRAWDCKVDGIAGGFQKFLEIMAPLFAEAAEGEPLKDLSENRGLKIEILKKFKVGWNGTHFTIPASATGSDGKTTDIQRYTLGKKAICTSGGHHGLFGFETKSNTVWICEGPWDTMALFDGLRTQGINDTVFGIEGAGNFPSELAGLFYNRTVHIAFDHDEPGRRGERRVFNLLKGIAKSIKSIHWPEDLPEGFDVRDFYKELKGDMRTFCETLKMRLVEEPRKLIDDEAKQIEAGELPEVPDGPGLEYEKVVEGYREWLEMPDPEILDIIFGTILANRLDGDPLWMFIVGPPGCGKTEPLMSLTGSPLIMTTTSLTPKALISGANFGGISEPSLIPKLNNKVLIVKDFTTILSMNFQARDEIFGILRDAYDGRIEWYFGTGLYRVYESRFGMLAGVTHIIERYNSAHTALGERFIHYKVRRKGTIDVGADIIDRALRNMTYETKMRKALSLVAKQVLDYPVDGSMVQNMLTDTFKIKLRKLAQLIASMRASISREKYTGEIHYKPIAEIGTRLAKQFCKLAFGIALFRHSKTVTDEHFRIVTKVARDTAPGRVEEAIRQMFLHYEKDKFVGISEIADWTRLPGQTVRAIMQDMTLLRIVEKKSGNLQSGRYRLTKSVLKLIEDTEIYAEELVWKNAKHQHQSSKKKIVITKPTAVKKILKVLKKKKKLLKGVNDGKGY